MLVYLEKGGLTYPDMHQSKQIKMEQQQSFALVQTTFEVVYAWKEDYTGPTFCRLSTV